MAKKKRIGYNKGKILGPRSYKKGRISRKGLTPYQIYMIKRSELEAEGYVLREITDEKTFMNRYNYAKSIGDTNFMRDYAKNDRYVSKQNYRRFMARIKKLNLNSPDATERFVKMKYMDVSFGEFQKWTEEDWSMYRDYMLDLGATFEEFRGIYE